MTKLQQIVKEAQKIRKQYPTKYSKWTDYIKAASKQVAGFEGVTRSGNKTTVKYSRAEKAPAKKKAAPKKAAPAAKKKAAPAAYQKSLFGVKKAPAKKVYGLDSVVRKGQRTDVNYTKISGMQQSTGVRVFFKNSKYNYTTTVSNNVTEEEAKKYFVGKLFNVGVYPKENIQKCIRIQYFKYQDQ
jgi:hypothetical protein